MRQWTKKDWEQFKESNKDKDVWSLAYMWICQHKQYEITYNVVKSREVMQNPPQEMIDFITMTECPFTKIEIKNINNQ